MFPAESSPRAHYSYRWAETIVSSLVSKYPRATGFFSKYAGISPRILAALLADGRVEYAQARNCIHWLDKWAPRPGWDATNECWGGPVCQPGEEKRILEGLARSMHRKLAPKFYAYLTEKISELH